jgi:REP element-mobilizing transposase RayT
MTAIRQAFYGGKDRFGFRLVHFCVQRNHIHLVAEVDDRQALLRGMRGLSIRVARQLNKARGRTGKVLADRYHVEVLDSFARIRRCLAYVLNNERRHCYQHGGWLKLADYIDPCSSGLFFDGWRQRMQRPSGLDPPVVEARGFPLRKGWRRHGLIAVDEIPGRRKTSK